MERLKFADFVLLIFCATGLAGSVIFSDEFDSFRLSLTSFVAVPGVVGWLYLRTSYPQVITRLRPLISAWMIGIISIFAWGNILLLNAVGDGQEEVEVAQSVGLATGNVAHYRGPLGIIYRSRF